MGCKDIGNRKTEFVAKTQFLWCRNINTLISWGEGGSPNALPPSLIFLPCTPLCKKVFLGQYNPASVSGYLQGLKIYRLSLKKVSWFKFLNEFLYFEHQKYLLKISVLKNRKKTVQNLDSVFYTKAFFSETPCVCKVYCIYHDLNSGYFHFFSLFRNLRKVQCKIACILFTNMYTVRYYTL